MADPTHILGISAFYHDSAACVARDGEIVAAAQEERFTRRKHDESFPAHAVRFCLREAGIEAGDLALVGYYEKPLIKFNRLLETSLTTAPLGLRRFYRWLPLWLGYRLWVADIIEKEMGEELEVRYCEHHESHAASAFFPSPFEEAAILTLDAVGEWTTASWGIGRGHQLELTAEIDFPHSLGMLYSAFTWYCGFRVNSGEYKLMGLAPYGEARYADLIREHLIDIKPDGSFRLNMDYFDYHVRDRMINRRFEELFGGPARKPESPLDERHMDLARSVQEVTEEVILRMARRLHRDTGAKNLCLAGGVALNCVANGRVLRETPFESVFIQPAAGDAGGAVGVALYLWHQCLDNPRVVGQGRDSMSGALLGPEFSDGEVKSCLDAEGVPYEKLPEDEIPRRVAELIAGGNVVGWFQGRMEFGPRALGCRSILGDARSQKMQSVLNLKIKFRESFRPFAPSVLKERAPEYFGIDVESPYMLLTAPVREARRTGESHDGLHGLQMLKVRRSDIPAVTHVDYSARLQTVSRADNPRYYDMIRAFEDLTGCAVIINTSFNVRGEPIVCTPDDAFRCFMRTHMDFLIMDRYLVDKRRMPERADIPPAEAAFAPD